MNEPTIHDIERMAMSRRWSLALVLILAITLVMATWIGLFGFLSANAGYAMFNRFVDPVDTGNRDRGHIARPAEPIQGLMDLTEDGERWPNCTRTDLGTGPVLEMPNALIWAVLAAEDGDYFQHGESTSRPSSAPSGTT